MEEDRCVKCEKQFDEKPTTIREKGLNTLLRLCTEQRFEDLLEKLNQKKEDGCAILLQAECRKKFTGKRKSAQIERPIKRLHRSMDQKFEWKSHCFLCGETVDCHHPDRESFSKVMKLELKNLFAAVC